MFIVLYDIALFYIRISSAPCLTPADSSAALCGPLRAIRHVITSLLAHMLNDETKHKHILLTNRCFRQ